ncbi:Polyamine oxidase [Hordeum vulgare]|nr:Polyamine oxidase [Hordeum vulgare]
MGGRIHNAKFAGVNVEMGANWVEGVNGDEMNPIWTMANGTGGLNLRTFRSDFSHLAGNTYKQDGGLYDEKLVEKIIERVDEVAESGRKLSSALHHNGQLDMSVMAMQRLNYQYVYSPCSFKF